MQNNTEIVFANLRGLYSHHKNDLETELYYSLYFRLKRASNCGMLERELELIEEELKLEQTFVREMEQTAHLVGVKAHNLKNIKKIMKMNELKFSYLFKAREGVQ